MDLVRERYVKWMSSACGKSNRLIMKVEDKGL